MCLRTTNLNHASRVLQLDLVELLHASSSQYASPSVIPFYLLRGNDMQTTYMACILPQKNETLMFIHECTRDTETPQSPVLPLNKLQWAYMYPAHLIYEIRVITGILPLHHPLIQGTPATHPHRIVPHTAFLHPLLALPLRKQALALP